MNKQPYIKTDSDVKNDLYNNKLKNLVKDQLNNQSNNILEDNLPRYGTAIDKNTNKIVEQTDKYLTRNKLFSENQNQKKYRISRINIDSRYRNIDPKNIINKYTTVINPFILTQNSNILKINMNVGHGLLVDDNITISDLKPLVQTLRSNSLSLKKNSQYLYINHQNHGFTGINNIISISGVINTNPLNYFFGTIPLSIINSEHTVILIVNNNITDFNNYMINLGIYSNIDYIYIESSFNINILTYNGVHLKYINASYPIIYDIQQGYHIIKESYSTYVTIMLSVISTNGYNTNNNNTINCTKPFGNNIQIGYITSIINGYPDPDYYKFELKKTYYKVKKIKLVSTEIPNSELLIKNTPSNIKNNMFYWQIQEDGDYIYSVQLTSGNYNTSSLLIELNNLISNTTRQFGSYINTNIYFNNNCNPNIIINPSNNLFSLQITSTIILSKNITISKAIYSDTYNRINIIHQYHNLNIGDQITISNSINVLDSTIDGINYFIPDEIINSIHIIELIIDINNYIIKLTKYNTIVITNSTNNLINGGNAVNIIYPLFIRLLFNYNDTIGNILGFKNPGNNLSITIFNKIITNQTLYINSSILNSVGVIDINTPIFNFSSYPYLLMVSEMFSSHINYKDSSGVFAKLFLTGNPGSIIYDQYIQITETLLSTMSYLNELEFMFLTPDGITYNFNGQNHSYTLEIYEELEENI